MSADPIQNELDAIVAQNQKGPLGGAYAKFLGFRGDIGNQDYASRLNGSQRAA